MTKPIRDQTLPPAPDLNIDAFSALFRHTTNSYKCVFFLALLTLLKRHHFASGRFYTYTEITVEMLVIAWFPHRFFGLSFGTQDTTTQKIDALELRFSTSIDRFAQDRPALREALHAADLKDAERLMDFVPYRLLIPFLETQLQFVDKGAWMVFERAMPAITNAHFERARPLYRFDSDDYRECASIRWHPDWAAYLERHFPTIEAWAQNHWLEYMQRRNPDALILHETLFPAEHV